MQASRCRSLPARRERFGHSMACLNPAYLESDRRLDPQAKIIVAKFVLFGIRMFGLSDWKEVSKSRGSLAFARSVTHDKT